MLLEEKIATMLLHVWLYSYICLYLHICTYNKYAVQTVWARWVEILGIQFDMGMRRWPTCTDGHKLCVYCTCVKCRVPCNHTLVLTCFQVPMTNVPPPTVHRQNGTGPD